MTNRAGEYVAALPILMGVIERGKTLDAGFVQNDPSPLVQQICYGVIREYYLLEAILNVLMDKPLAKKHADIRALLLAGLYSIRHLHRPDYASVDRVVETAGKRGKPWARGLINGVLRNYIRQRKDIDRKASHDRQATTNHPHWLARRIEDAWPDQAESIFEANNSYPPMTLRVNQRETSVADYIELLSSAGMAANPGWFGGDAVVLAEAVAIERLPGFGEGLVSVQDEASQLAARLLEPFAGARILDACAAPGGKACHILECEPGVALVAIDADEARATRISTNLERLNLHAEVIVRDLGEFSSTTPFDRVLLDAPCSATGVIRRHPDIKLLRRETDIDKLAATQLALLRHAWSLLSVDGVLLYSTCSVLPEENDAIISEFVSNRGDVKIMPIEGTWGYATSSGRQLLPEKGGCDGFFYAKMRKMRSD
ncbi:MAG: 16S rRNA (cytosine(967)-C(5))-methyltransferase RsmB [Pseudomonadales bacterium]|nr:16S rRNA (cytosine(967)-C(5))-methyltransferase RsmB [Pseudomonadales bacterium]